VNLIAGAGIQLFCTTAWSDVQASVTSALQHDERGYLHQIILVPGST
jgi:hypothetical protein